MYHLYSEPESGDECTACTMKLIVVMGAPHHPETDGADGGDECIASTLNLVVVIGLPPLP